MSKVEWRIWIEEIKYSWKVGDKAQRLACREYDMKLCVSNDVWCKCEKAKAYVVDKNMFSDRISFTMTIPEYDLVASTYTAHDLPTEVDMHYTEVDFVRHEGKIYIVGIRENKKVIQ